MKRAWVVLCLVLAACVAPIAPTPVVLVQKEPLICGVALDFTTMRVVVRYVASGRCPDGAGARETWRPIPATSAQLSGICKWVAIALQHGHPYPIVTADCSGVIHEASQ